MKKLMMTAVMLTATVCASAQSETAPVEPYFTSEEMPDMTKWCPEPPDTVSAAFAYDIMQYMWGKQMRNNKQRADIAYRDAEYSLEYIAQEFSVPFGLEISQENTPEIYKLLRNGTATCDSICRTAKIYFKRMRPFVRFKEPTLRPEYEPHMGSHRSFPSGHTILGWSTALLLTEVNPERADTILSRGCQRRCYGCYSRLCPSAHQRALLRADAPGPPGVPLQERSRHPSRTEGLQESHKEIKRYKESPLHSRGGDF